MYCDICISTLRDRKFGYAEYPAAIYGLDLLHHETFSSLRASVDAGCYICFHVWRVLCGPEGSERRRDLDRWMASGRDQPPANRPPPGNRLPREELLALGYATHCSLNFWPAPEGTQKWPRFPFTIEICQPWKDSQDTVSCDFAVNLPPISSPRYCLEGSATFLPPARAVTKTWLETCADGEASHELCRKTMQRGWYPTRLIDTSAAAEGSVRLVVTAQESIHGPYATLSHCWGSSKFLNLSRANLAEWATTGIPISDLPKTFRDSVEVCLELSLRYIWIDALCIVQDDLEDWQAESVRMDKVYSCCHLNIADAASSDSSGGLFRSRTPVSPDGPDLEMFMLGIEGFPEGTTEKCWLRNITEWRDTVEKSALNSRAWVYQERLLAPRVLLFGQYQLHWLCRRAHFMECQPTQALHEDAPNFWDKKWFAKVHVENHGYEAAGGSVRVHEETNETEDLESDPATNPGFYFDDLERDPTISTCFFWGILVMRYSELSLTKATDRLVAISGLARVMSSATRDDYVAGMWRKGLERQLLWHRNLAPIYEDLPWRETEEYVAPSFSWASVPGHPVVYEYDRPLKDGTEMYLFEILDLQLRHATEDLFGAVTGGHLDVCCSLKPLKLHDRSNTATGPQFTVEGVTVPPFTGVNVWLDRLTDKEHKQEDTTYYYMPAYCRRSWFSHALRCMLLVVVDETEGLYRRVGILDILAPFDAQTGPELVRALLEYEGQEHEVPNRGRKGGSYIIRIV